MGGGAWAGGVAAPVKCLSPLQPGNQRDSAKTSGGRSQGPGLVQTAAQEPGATARSLHLGSR